MKAAVDGLPKVPGPKVYYAEGADGLATEGRGSFHAELIELAGGRNVHQGKMGQCYVRLTRNSDALSFSFR